MNETGKQDMQDATEQAQHTQSDEAGTAESPELAELEAEIAALRAERDEMQDRMMRALADAENSRKRAEKDRREAQQYGGSRFVRDMLPVYDSLQRALEASRAAQDGGGDNDAVAEGVDLTLRELLNIFERHGVTRVSPVAGDTFDPQLHEAMYEAPVPDIPAGGIIQVMAEGFMLHDRLLRPAQVGVSSTPAG